MNMDQARFEAAANSQIAADTDVNMTNSVFAGTPGSTATGDVDIVGAFAGGGPSTLEGTVPAGITLDVEGTTLNAPPVTATVNAGTINLSGNGAELKVLPNDPDLNSTSRLTNTGTIEFTSGASRRASASSPATSSTRATILVNHPEASFQFPGGTNTPPKLTNQGTITVSAGNNLRVLFGTFVHGDDSVIDGAGSMTVGNSRFEISGDGLIAATTDVNIDSANVISGVAGSTATGNLDVRGDSTASMGRFPPGSRSTSRAAPWSRPR